MIVVEGGITGNVRGGGTDDDDVVGSVVYVGIGDDVTEQNSDTHMNSN